MNTINITIKKLCLAVLLVFMVIITLWTGINISQDAAVLREYPVLRRVMSMGFGIAFSFVLALKLQTLEKSAMLIKLRSIIWSAIIILQLAVLFIYTPGQITDAYMINDQALALAYGIDTVIDQTDLYFLLYKNNHLLTIMLSWIYSVLAALNLSAFSDKILALINILCIDISIVYLCKIARKKRGESYEVKVLFLLSLNPMNYVLIYWFYSLVLSMPLMVVPVYLAVCKKEKMLSIIEIGILAVVGYFIRPTILIPIIAVAVYGILSIRKSTDFKHLALTLLTSLIISAALFYAINHLINSYASDSSRYLPMIHWYMMGMHGDGGAYATDIAYIGSFANTKEMYDEALGNIRWTRTLYTPVTFAKHELLKLAKTWANGSADYRLGLYTGMVNSDVYDWMCGNKSDAFLLYCQIYRFAIYLLSMSACIKMFFERELMDERAVFAIALLGGIVFYILWEAKAVYSVPFIPFAIYLSADSCGCKLFALKAKTHKVYRTVLFSSLALTAVCAVLLFDAFTKDASEYNDYSLFTQGFTFSLYTDTSESNIEQTFSVSRPFNAIEIEMISSDDRGKSIVSVFDAEGNVIAEQTVQPQDIENEYCVINVPYQDIHKKTGYTLKIDAIDEGLEVCHMKSKVLKLYEGEALADGHVIPANINIRVSNLSSKTNMVVYEYLTIIFLSVLLQVAVIIKEKRLHKAVCNQ